MISLLRLDKEGVKYAQNMVTMYHYLHRPVDPRTTPEGYEIGLTDVNRPVGWLLFGRPEATRCADWYGGVEDVITGRCEVTRWQVLNLSRVLLDKVFQVGGVMYGPAYLPGFVDRKGVWRSTLASLALQAVMRRVGFEYLVQRPPVFLDEPYEIKWLLSYCDTRLHKGTIYRAAGFELYRTNGDGIQTWRIRLPGLTAEQDAQVREASRVSPRAQKFREERAQLRLL